MTHGLFLKTWKNDLVWLPYLFRSIDKFVTGYDQLVIICDTTSEAEKIQAMQLPKSVKNISIVQVSRPHDFHGYVWQQYIKICAYDYLHTDTITFIDSDCVFMRETNPLDFMNGGKIVMLKTHYSRIVSPWKPITEKAVKFEVDWEYMRRLPLTYWRNSLIMIKIYRKDLYDYTKQASEKREFSEFNFMGALIEKYEPDMYHFHDTEFGLPATHISQGWSWGGLNEQEKQRMEEILK